MSSIAGGSYTYEYDSLDRVVSITWLFQTRTYTTRYHYDPSGCLDRLTYPTGAVFVMTCDRAGRPTSIKQELSAGVTQTIVSTAGYNAIGRATSATYGNGRVVTTTFLNGRIDTIASPNVVSLKYVYDGADNVISVTDGQNPANNASPISYDKLDRLRTVATPGGSFDFDYDAMGNRLYADVPGQSRTTYGYSPTTGRLETSNGPQAPSPLTLSWSAGERIATSSDGATYVYDVLGRRIRKTQPTASMDVVFHYDSSGHLLAETDVNGNRIREYVYLQGQFVATQGCLRGFTVTCQDRAWVFTDLVGTVVARADASGVALFDSRPWGASGPSDEPRRFNGKWYDRGIDAVNFGAREFLPSLGRFISVDAVWTPTNSRHANSYVFALANPYKFADPSGNLPVNAVTGILGAATFLPQNACVISPQAASRYAEAQHLAYQTAYASKFLDGPELGQLIRETGSGPRVRFADTPVSFRAHTEISLARGGSIDVGDITIDRSFVESATVEQIAHVLVHEVGHWSFWTAAAVSGAPDRHLLSRFLNAPTERMYRSATSLEDPQFLKPWLPTEGYGAELIVFGSVYTPPCAT